MNNSINCKELFTINDFFLKELFSDNKHPWETLPNLRRLIESIIEQGIDGYSLMKPGVLIGKDVSIADSARIESPVIIADGCEVRHGAYLRGSVILGKGCVIGNSSEVKNSILMNKVQAPHYNYIGDSILGRGVHLGAGAICSNLRSDKQHVSVKDGTLCLKTGMRKLGAILGDGVEIGCGAVLCPGTVIGKNTTVYPLTVTRGVYPENSIVKDTYTVVSKRSSLE